MIKSEIKNTHLLKLLFYNQLINKKFTLIWVTLLSIFVTSNDYAVKELWGETLGYMLAALVFLTNFTIYIIIFVIIMFIIYALNTSLRKGLGVYEYQITDDGLIENSKLGSLTMNWVSIVKVHRRKNSAYIERSGDHWSIILKEGNETSYDDFINEICNKLPNE